MDSQKNIFSTSPSLVDPDEARRRFLASMGLGEEPLETVSRSGRPLAREDEGDGVVLSSSPDDLELPGASAREPSRVSAPVHEVAALDVLEEELAEQELSEEEFPEEVEFTVWAEATVEPAPVTGVEVEEVEPVASVSTQVEEVAAVAPVAMEVEEVAAVAPVATQVEEVEPVVPVSTQVEEVEPVVPVATQVEEVATVAPVTTQVEEVSEPVAPIEIKNQEEEPLQLQCPKCHGELVLMQAHVGIEGACVWCETKIVAARSGKDGAVRVFPLFQPDPTPVHDPTPVQTVVEPPARETKAETVEIPAADFMDAVDEVPPKEVLPQKSEEAESEAEEEVFGGDALSAEVLPDSAGIPAGFDDFSPAIEAQLQIETPAAESPSGFEGFSSLPAARKELPAADAGIPSGFESGFSAGFDSPRSMSQPAPAPAPAPAPEVEAEEGPKVADFSRDWSDAPSSGGFPSGFSASPFSNEIKAAFDAPVKPEAAAEPAPMEESGALEVEPMSGFESPTPWGPPSAVAEKTPEAPVPEKQVESDAPPTILDADVAIQSGFASVPAQPSEPGFEGTPLWGSSREGTEPALKGTSTAVPSAGLTDPIDPLDFGAPAKAESLTGFASGFEIPSSGNAEFSADRPAPDQVAGSIFSASDDEDLEVEKPKAWGDSPAFEGTLEIARPQETDEDFRVEEKPGSPSDGPAAAVGSLFREAASSDALPAGPPPVPQTALPQTALPQTALPPQVTSQPLGSKPSKRRGKGMTVFFVIFLGLVCGAALASFVLPVDEYVLKARSFIEQKLSAESAADPTSFINNLVIPSSEAAGGPVEVSPPQ